MSLKRFNHQYSSILNGRNSFSAENEARIDDLLKETAAADDYIEGVQELPVVLNNLGQIVLQFGPKSGSFEKSVQLIEKMIAALKPQLNKDSAIFLPILTDILYKSPHRIAHTLKLIQDVSFGIIIKTCQHFLERLIEFCVKILCDEPKKTCYDIKIRTLALSVLINVCSKNAISFGLLEQQINVMDLQKKIPLETYGILTCKMNLVLNECGHLLRDAHVHNFLKYMMQELHRIPSLDKNTLQHLIEFIRDICERNNHKQILQQYDFALGIKTAIMTLEGTTNQVISDHINALFEIITIVTLAKNNSLKNLDITIVNFAIKRLKSADCCIQALEILTTIFNNESKITTSNFELEEMQETLNAILFSNDRQPDVLAPLFKLLNVLAKKFDVNLMKNQVVDTIFAPLLKLDRLQYVNLPPIDVSMYLECLALLSTLMERKFLKHDANLFQMVNVQFLVAMSIKHGNTDQCALALSLMNRFSNCGIAEMITAKANCVKVSDSQLMSQNHGYAMGKDVSKELESERMKNVFTKIESAVLSDKFDVPCSDLIALYTTELSMLNRQIQIWKEKYEVALNEVKCMNDQNMQLKVVSMKWSELAQNFQRSSETRKAEIDEMDGIVKSLREKNRKTAIELEEVTGKLAQDQNAISEKDARIKTLEEEIKEIEDTISSLLGKRKKPQKTDA